MTIQFVASQIARNLCLLIRIVQISVVFYSFDRAQTYSWQKNFLLRCIVDTSINKIMIPTSIFSLFGAWARSILNTPEISWIPCIFIKRSLGSTLILGYFVQIHIIIPHANLARITLQGCNLLGWKQF